MDIPILNRNFRSKYLTFRLENIGSRTEMGYFSIKFDLKFKNNQKPKLRTNPHRIASISLISGLFIAILRAKFSRKTDILKEGSIASVSLKMTKNLVGAYYMTNLKEMEMSAWIDSRSLLVFQKSIYIFTSDIQEKIFCIKLDLFKSLLKSRNISKFCQTVKKALLQFSDIRGLS